MDDRFTPLAPKTRPEVILERGATGASGLIAKGMETLSELPTPMNMAGGGTGVRADRGGMFRALHGASQDKLAELETQSGPRTTLADVRAQEGVIPTARKLGQFGSEAILEMAPYSAAIAGAAALGGTPAALMAGYPLAVGDVRTELENAGVTDRRALAGASLTAAVPYTLLDIATESQAAKRVLGEPIQRMVARPLAHRLAAETARSAAMEGATEGLQKEISLGTTAAVTGDIRHLTERQPEVIEEAAAGVFGGGAMGGVAGAAPDNARLKNLGRGEDGRIYYEHQATGQIMARMPGGGKLVRVQPELEGPVPVTDPTRAAHRVLGDKAVQAEPTTFRSEEDQRQRDIFNALPAPTLPAPAQKPAAATPAPEVLPTPQPEAAPERILAAAIQTSDGRIGKGGTHDAALFDMFGEDTSQWPDAEDYQRGYVTNTGRFLTDMEARSVAAAAGQASDRGGRLESSEVDADEKFGEDEEEQVVGGRPAGTRDVSEDEFFAANPEVRDAISRLSQRGEGEPVNLVDILRGKVPEQQESALPIGEESDKALVQLIADSDTARQVAEFEMADREESRDPVVDDAYSELLRRVSASPDPEAAARRIASLGPAHFDQGRFADDLLNDAAMVPPTTASPTREAIKGARMGQAPAPVSEPASTTPAAKQPTRTFNPEGRSAIISPSAREPGRFQATFFDGGGTQPLSHTTHDSEADALSELEREGYTLPEAPKLENLTPEQQTLYNELSEQLSHLDSWRDHGDDFGPDQELERKQIIRELRDLVTPKPAAAAKPKQPKKQKQTIEIVTTTTSTSKPAASEPIRKVGTLGLHVRKNPAGSWSFEGSVPDELKFTRQDGSPPTAEDMKIAGHSGPGFARLKARNWPTEKAAVAALEEYESRQKPAAPAPAQPGKVNLPPPARKKPVSAKTIDELIAEEWDADEEDNYGATTTPGTRVHWKNVSEWLDGYDAIIHRKISTTRHSQEDAHLEAIVGSGVIESESDVEVLNRALSLVKSEQPARGLRKDHHTTKTIDAIQNRLQALQPKPTKAKLVPQRREDGGIEYVTIPEGTPAFDAASKPDFGEDNKVFTRSAADAARERLKKKLDGKQLNTGIDPELMVDAVTLGGYYIEGGIRKFSDWAAKMLEDLGDGFSPFLRWTYDSIRRYPGFDSNGMTPESEITDLPAKKPAPRRMAVITDEKTGKKAEAELQAGPPPLEGATSLPAPAKKKTVGAQATDSATKLSTAELLTRWRRNIRAGALAEADAEGAGPGVRRKIDNADPNLAIGAVGTGSGAYARGRRSQADDRLQAYEDELRKRGVPIPHPDEAWFDIPRDEIPHQLEEEFDALREGKFTNDEILELYAEAEYDLGLNRDDRLATIRRGIYGAELLSRGLDTQRSEAFEGDEEFESDNPTDLFGNEREPTVEQGGLFGTRDFAAGEKVQADKVSGRKMNAEEVAALTGESGAADTDSGNLFDAPVVQKTVEQAGNTASPEDMATLIEAATEMVSRLEIPPNPTSMVRWAEEVLEGKRHESDFILDDVYDAFEGAANRFATDMIGPQTGPGAGIIDRLKALREFEDRIFTGRTSTAAVKARQQFSTPLPIAEAAAYAASVHNTESVLEPTAGTGNLINPVRRPGVKIHTNELEPRRVAVLNALGGLEVTSEDALRLQLNGRRYSKIITNPPYGTIRKDQYSGFGAAPFNATDVAQRFFAAALNSLAEGGRIVAVMPMNTITDQGIAFRQWLRDNHTPVAYIQSPEDSYKSRGVRGSSVIVVVDKVKGDGKAEPLYVENPTWDQWYKAIEYFDATRKGFKREAVEATDVAAIETQKRETGVKKQAKLVDHSGPSSETTTGDAAPDPITAAVERMADALVTTVEARLNPQGGNRESTATTTPTSPTEGVDGGNRAASARGGGVLGVSGPQESESGRRAGSGSGTERGAGVVAPPAPEDSGAAESGSAPGMVSGSTRRRVEAREGDSEQRRREIEAANDSPVFAPYTVGVGAVRNPHPRLVVETRSMAGIEAPAITASLKSPLTRAAWGRDGSKGGVSDEQVDAALRALSAWDAGHGFIIADDVGVGKSREAAVVVLEALARGEKKILYTTKNENNVADVMAELRRVATGSEDGTFPAAFVFVGDYPGVKKGTEDLPVPDGPVIYFAHSYNFSDFAGALQAVKPTVWIADEAHEFRNLQSNRGVAWGDLHNDLLERNGKTLYLTATPAVSLDELGYLYGLKLWKVGAFGDWIERKLGKAGPDQSGDKAAAAAANAQQAAQNVSMGDTAGVEGDEQLAKGKRKFMRASNDAFAMKVTPAETEQVMRELKGGGYYIARDLWRGGVEFGVEWLDLLGIGDPDLSAEDRIKRYMPEAKEAFARVAKGMGGANAGVDSDFETGARARFEGQLERPLGESDAYLVGWNWADSKVRAEPSEGKAARERYNGAAKLVREISMAARKYGRLNERDKHGGLERAQLQAYMKAMLFNLRLPHVLRLADKSLAEGKQVVISIHSVSGDEEMTEGTVDFEQVNAALMSAINAINTQQIKKHGKGGEATFEDLGDIPEALMAVASLKSEAATMIPLRDPVRAIEEHFGAKHVAPITGRQTAKKRREAMGEFQAGKRKVAIISKAGKVGISLHDVNGKSRHLIVSDYEWSADLFKQELGRVDRTGQKSPPKISLVATNIAGERKFAATIAARMASLGATSKGSAESTGTDALDQFEMSGDIPLNAMRNAVERMDKPDKEYFTGAAFMELTKQYDGGVEFIPKRRPGEDADMRKFLLEMLMFPVEVSDRVMALYNEEREALMTGEARELLAARRTGRSHGEVLRVTQLSAKPPITLYEIKNAAGEKMGIVHGFVTEYIAEIQKVRGPDSMGRDRSRRYVQFTADADGELISGLEVAPSEARRLLEFFGKSERKEITAADAWTDLHAGDKIAIVGARNEDWELHLRQDGKIQIRNTTLARNNDDLNSLPKGTVGYSSVGNFLFIQPTQEALTKFMERYPARVTMQTRAEQGKPDAGQGGIEFRHSFGLPAVMEAFSGKTGVSTEAILPSSDEEVEARWQGAKGIKSESVLSKVKKGAKEAKSAFTRHFKHLDPNGPPSILLTAETLRQYEASPNWAKTVAYDRLAAIVEGLSAPEVDLMTRVLVLRDLTRSAEEGLYGGTEEDGKWTPDPGAELPYGYTPESLATDLERFEQKAIDTEKVRLALEKRANFARSLTEQLVAHELLRAEVLKDDRYYHRMVMEYANATEFKGVGTSSNDVRLKRKGFQKQRQGSEKDANTLYQEAEFEWVAQALALIARKETLDRVRQLNDVRPGLEGQAKVANELLVRERDRQRQRRALGLRPDEPDPDNLDDPFAPFKRKIGRAQAQLRQLLKAGELDDMEFRFRHMFEAWRASGNGRFDHGDWWRFLSALAAEEEHEGNIAARSIFKAIREREEFIRTTLGKDYQTWHDLVPEGYSVWQPEKGQHFFLGSSIAEQVLDQVIAGEKTLKDSDVRKMLMVGGRKEEWVIPDSVAVTLDDFNPPRNEHIIEQIWTGAQSSWKQWVLLNPVRVLKYNLNNLSGDIDIAMAYDPAILKGFRQAARDLWLYTVKRKGSPELKAEIQEAMRLGVVDSGLTIAEVADINKAGAFKALAELDSKHGSGAIQKYWNNEAWGGVRGFTTWRENILRLAAYRYFQQQVAKGKPVYGASSRKAIDAITDPKDRAARLARDLVGDYGNISVGGQWMRRHLIPFYSWIEINAPRYVRMMANASHEGQSTGSRGARTTGVAVKKAALAAPGLLLRFHAMYILVNLWNHLLFGDEEEELRREARTAHLILGRAEDGSIRTLRIEGAFADALEWLGMNDYPADIADMIEGRADALDKLVEAPKSAINRFVQGLEPFSKTVYEITSGMSAYPNIFEPGKAMGLKARPIRDRGETIARVLSLDAIYKRVMQRPRRPSAPGPLGWIENMVTYRTDPGEAAYWESRQLAIDYLREQGQETPSIIPTKRQNALYYYKQSVKWGDEERAAHWLQQYYELGGKRQYVKSSLTRSAPLGALNEVDRRQFRRSLSEDEKEIVRLAESWYRQTYPGTTGARLAQPTATPTGGVGRVVPARFSRPSRPSR